MRRTGGKRRMLEKKKFFLSKGIEKSFCSYGQTVKYSVIPTKKLKYFNKSMVSERSQLKMVTLLDILNHKVFKN